MKQKIFQRLSLLLEQIQQRVKGICLLPPDKSPFKNIDPRKQKIGQINIDIDYWLRTTEKSLGFPTLNLPCKSMCSTFSATFVLKIELCLPTTLLFKLTLYSSTIIITNRKSALEKNTKIRSSKLRLSIFAPETGEPSAGNISVAFGEAQRTEGLKVSRSVGKRDVCS